MRLHGPEAHTLLGAYAMDALDDSDRAWFERHIARCESCRRELRGLRETTARLAVAAAVPPPARLKEKVLAATRGVRQQAPGAGAPPRPAWKGWAALAGAAAVVLVVGLVLLVRGPSSSTGPDQRRNQAIAAVLTAPDATLLSAKAKGGGTVTVVMSRTEHALVFVAADLPKLVQPETYELWLTGPSGERPAGFLPAARHGMTGPVVSADLHPGDHLALAMETSRNAARPTEMLVTLTL